MYFIKANLHFIGSSHLRNVVEMNGLVTYIIKDRYFHKYIQSAPEFGKTFHFEISQFAMLKTKDTSRLYRMCIEDLDGSTQWYSKDIEGVRNIVPS